MFRKPLRRDPLVVGWVVLMLVAAFVALSNNTTWSGHFQAERVAGFLHDVVEAFLWSFLLLLFAASLRSRTRSWTAGQGGRTAPSQPSFAPLPWTDRWIRDWRHAEAQLIGGAVEAPENGLPVRCRHGVPVDVPSQLAQAPVLRALSVSHAIVQPGGRVNVTWCFADCQSVVVDGRGGHPACGEAVVQVDASRRIEVVGRNRHGSTAVGTATVLALPLPQLDLPTAVTPPAVSMRTDVAATVGGSTPITQRLDDFWSTQDALRPRPAPPVPLVGVPPALAGVPTSLIRGLRRARPTTEEG